MIEQDLAKQVRREKSLEKFPTMQQCMGYEKPHNKVSTEISHLYLNPSGQSIRVYQPRCYGIRNSIDSLSNSSRERSIKSNTSQEMNRLTLPLNHGSLRSINESMGVRPTDRERDFVRMFRRDNSGSRTLENTRPSSRLRLTDLMH